MAADEMAFKKTVVAWNPPLAGGGVVLLHTHVHADIHQGRSLEDRMDMARRKDIIEGE